MSLPLPDPDGLEEARQLEVRRRWLYGIGSLVTGITFYVNAMVGLVGTAVTSTFQSIWWGWVAMGAVFLLGLPVLAYVALYRWRASHTAEARELLIARFELPRPAAWRRWLFLAVAFAFGGAVVSLASFHAALGWSVILGAQLIGIPIRFRRLGVSWPWAVHLVIWVALSIAAVWGAYAWIGMDSVVWVGPATIVLSPMVLVNLLLSERVKQAALATPGRGLARLEPLLGWHHLADLALQRGEAAWVEPLMARIVALRPTLERQFVLLGRSFEARAHPAIVDFWVLGTQLMPTNPEVFARLAERVDDPELALAYARFAEANALRRPMGKDTERYTALCARLQGAE